MSLISWNYIKSCFNSTAWYDAAKDHAKKTAPTTIDAYNNKGMTVLNAAIVGAALVGSQTTQNAVKKPGKLAQVLIQTPIDQWANATANKENYKPQKVEATAFLAEVVTKLVTVAGGAVILAGLYATSNAATKITKAAVVERSKDGVKAAVSESWTDATTLYHGFLAVGDLVAGAVCYLIVDGLIKACNQTADSLPHDEAPIIAGDEVAGGDN